jgi:metallophosphoesterase superfamily enzyme
MDCERTPMSIVVLQDWLLTPYRLAIHQPTSTAVVADVHLGYREARRHTGEAVPLLGMCEQLAPIRRARRRLAFDKLLVAGDLFERGVRPDLLEAFLADLHSAGIEFAGLIPGNHDRGWEAVQQSIRLFPEGTTLGDWTIVHGDGDCPRGPSVCGHWHPVLAYAGRRVACYLVGRQQLVLPAYSADAAGEIVADQARWRGWQRYGILAESVAACPNGPSMIRRSGQRRVPSRK